MKILRISVMLLSILSATLGFTAEIISFDQSNPPFMYEQGGRVRGLYPDLIAEAFRRIGQPVTLQCQPWTRVLVGVDRGDWGVGGIFFTSERNRKYDFSEPIYAEVLRLYVLQGHEFPFEGLADLYGRHIGVLRGWSYGDDFDRAVAEGRITTEAVNSDLINISRLLLGRVDAVIMIPEGYALIRNSRNLNDRVIALKSPLAVNKTYLSFSKSSHKTYLLDRFNTAMQAMRADGTFERIVLFNLR